MKVNFFHGNHHRSTCLQIMQGAFTIKLKAPPIFQQSTLLIETDIILQNGFSIVVSIVFLAAYNSTFK